jgi:hypothetical protein
VHDDVSGVAVDAAASCRTTPRSSAVARKPLRRQYFNKRKNLSATITKTANCSGRINGLTVEQTSDLAEERGSQFLPSVFELVSDVDPKARSTDSVSHAHMNFRSIFSLQNVPDQEDNDI